MAARFFVLCVSLSLIQKMSAQCIGNGLIADAYAPGLSPYGAYGGIGPGCGTAFTPSSGGGFPITSASPITPTGISVISENAIEGAVAIIGDLPFLGAVALEGTLPTAGAGGINYGCGSGAIGIVSELPAYSPAVAAGPARYGYGGGLAPGFAGSALAGPGYGCNGLSGFGPMY